MRVVCAGHAIKEIMTAGECLTALLRGAEKAGTEVSGKFLVSDGGDGFLDAFEWNRPCRRNTISTTGPLGDAIEAEFLLDVDKSVAIIESARACGLVLVEPQRRNIMISGTAGLADLIGAARHAGAKEVLVGLGGSATCDGGIGLLWRLAELTGKCQPCDNEFKIALDLSELPPPDLQDIKEWLGDLRIVACTDVDNPLLGERGAARTFAAQKGATSEEVEQLEAFMEGWAQRVERSAGMELRTAPGSGSAGGLGFALAAVGAELELGGTTFCKWIGLEEALSDGTVVATAEGRFDHTSLGGKAPWTVALLARQQQAQPVILCGAADPEAVLEAGKSGVAVKEFAPGLPVEERKTKTPELLSDALEQYLNETESEPA